MLEWGNDCERLFWLLPGGELPNVSKIHVAEKPARVRNMLDLRRIEPHESGTGCIRRYGIIG